MELLLSNIYSYCNFKPPTPRYISLRLLPPESEFISQWHLQQNNSSALLQQAGGDCSEIKRHQHVLD